MYVRDDRTNTYVVCLSRDFLEVAGSLVEQSIEPRVLQHLLGLLLQKPHLRRTKTDDSSPWPKKDEATCSAMTVSLLPAVARVNWSAF